MSEGEPDSQLPELETIGTFPLPAMHDSGETVASPLASLHRPAETLGSQIGAYKILQVLGEGGFGTVFLAEQKTPIRRKVALKIIKLGMDTKEVIARFEAERQALAMMDHPNIAKVFDAGSTDSGRPYFVMELVKGVPLTKYCDMLNLSTRERLDLFREVCLGVQHAHQKGIIHRDLKPSNVLVTEEDGKPVPKVIDFGVAKATSGRLTDKTLNTELNTIIGTPEYMSPEQAELSALDIDTRSDIYALGVILYELLTSTTPFIGKELRAHSFDEIRRIIREVEPPRPSTRLHTLGPALATVAKNRQAEPRKLEESLRGELDWIVMKALEKNRARRYDTAQGLSLDIQHYLHDEPVLARPATMKYRAGKFVRKHRVGAASVAFVALALVLGIIGTTIGMRRARIAEEVASDRLLQVRNAQDLIEKEAANARAAEADARQHQTIAEQAKSESDMQARKAHVALVGSHIAEADALLKSGARYEAEGLYEGAERDGDKLGLSPWPARLGLFDAYRMVRPPIVTIDAKHKLRGVDFLPDNRFAISLSEEGLFEVWDLPTGRRIRSFGELGPNGGDIFALSQDGSIALSGSQSAKSTELKIWDVASGQLSYAISSAGTRPVSFSPDGTYICLGGVDLDVYETGTGKRAYQIKQDLKRADAHWTFLSEISPDNRFGLCGRFGAVELREIRTGLRVKSVVTPEFSHVHASFPTGGAWVLMGDNDGNLRRWAYPTTAPTVDFADRHSRGIVQLRTTADGKRAYTASKDGTIRKWDVETLRSTGVVAFGPRWFRGFGVSRDEKMLIAAPAGSEISLWSLEVAPWATAVDDNRATGTAIGASADGTLLVTGHASSPALRIWDLATRRQVGSVNRLADGVFPSNMRVSAGGDFALTAIEDRFGVITGIARWDLQPCGGGHFVEAPTSDGFEQVFAPNDKCLLTEDAGDHRVRIWDARTLTEVAEDSAAARELVDASTRTLLDAVRRQRMQLPVAVAKNGTYAAARYGGISPRPNKSPTQLNLRHTIDAAFTAMTDSGIPVCGAALTPDGSVIFEACGDGNLRAFGTNKGQMIRVMSGHAAFVQTIAMSATGDRLFSAGSDRTHRIWDFAAIDDVRRLGPIQQQARETLQSDPQNAAALKTFGDWYVLHGQWAWALEMFVQARAHGAAIPDLTLARCYWQTGDLKAAEQAFTAAINAKEAPEHYLQLCLAAVKNEKAMQKEK